MSVFASGIRDDSPDSRAARDDVLTSIRRMVAEDTGGRHATGNAVAAAVSPGMAENVLHLDAPVEPVAPAERPAVEKAREWPQAVVEGGHGMSLTGIETMGAETGAETGTDEAQPAADPLGLAALRAAIRARGAGNQPAVASPEGEEVMTPIPNEQTFGHQFAASSGPAPVAAGVSALETPPENALAALVGDMIRDVVRNELHSNAGRLAEDLRLMLLRELAQAITAK